MVLIKVAAVELEVEREVVAGAGGDAGDDSQRAVAAGDAEGVRTARHRLFDQRRQACTRGLPAAGLRVEEEHGPPRRTCAGPHGERRRQRKFIGSGSIAPRQPHLL